MASEGDLNWLPKTMEEWETMKSTKLDLVAKLAKYLLSDDNCPKNFLDENGEFTIPVYVAPAGAKKTDKILIFQEYMSLTPLLKRVSKLRHRRHVLQIHNATKVLELHGVKCLVLNGGVARNKRMDILKKFTQDDEPRALIISKVGTTGLNCSRANHVLVVVCKNYPVICGRT
jgi:SNF2 family DNA or RNA helicase